MTPTECVQFVLVVKQLVPAQRVEEFTPDVWHPVLADIPLVDAIAAAQRVIRSEPWISPHAIVREWKAIRADRRRVEQKAAPRALPSRFETDEERAARIARGVAACRQQIGEPAEPLAIADRPATRSEQVRTAALTRALSEPRDRRTDPTSAGASFGAALNHIRRPTTPPTATTPGDHR